MININAGETTERLSCACSRDFNVTCELQITKGSAAASEYPKAQICYCPFCGEAGVEETE